MLLWDALQAFIILLFISMNYKPRFQLWTFFSFVNVAHPEPVAQEHYDFCMDLWLRGRVYIGTEGISSTVSGTTRQLRAYEQYLSQHYLFSNILDIHTKASDIEGHCFDRMTVKVRDEIVVLGAKVTAAEVEKYSKNISIDELHEIMSQRDTDPQIREDVAILDMRNTYEYKLWHFKGALPAGTINFREVKDLITHYKEYFKNKKKIIMYCTGGIRCDKLSVLMKKEGFDSIYGVDGGVVKYVHTHNDGARLGSLYTFDGVISKYVGDSTTHTTIGRCIYSWVSSDYCANCRYSECNARIICDPNIYKQYAWFCSKLCYEQAVQTLMVKDMERDTFHYQEMRSQLKRKELQGIKEELKADAIKKISRHLAAIVGERERTHQTSQQETIIDAHILEDMLQI